MKKTIFLILGLSIGLIGCKKEENPMCEVLRNDLKHIYENDFESFEENKINYWTKMDELDCNRRKIKSSWNNIIIN